MKILIIGSGGREHTFTWKIAQSPDVEKIFCVPGNAGMAQLAECRQIDIGNLSALAEFAKAESIDLTVVGPEAPLADGLVDVFSKHGLRAFGPSKAAAEIEGSKAFAKELMAKYDIPTAEYRIFDDADAAEKYIKKVGAPIVVKASGLAAGKGVIVCQTIDQAIEAVNTIMVDRKFGDSGDLVVIEECLIGEEATFTVLTDGEKILPLVTSQDHKPAYDGGKGPNTGGMGAYSPAPVITAELHDEIMGTIVEPTMRGMAAEGREYMGFLYVGLMIDDGVPKVLEFNCRLGDPEAQVILPRMKSELVPSLVACIEGNLAQIELEWRSDPAVCVIMASGGYPIKYEKGKRISGLDEINKMEDVVVFHAGTAEDDRKIFTNGGRVLGVTALDKDIESAIDRAYQAVKKISFEKVHLRTDIGHKALDRN